MEKERKIYEALRWASSFLAENDYEATIGERLMVHHTGWTRSRLLSELQTPFADDLWLKFRMDVEKSASGVPVQHITGEEMFYGRSFLVNQHVLIPRPETEELVEAVIGKIADHFSDRKDSLEIVDVGAGSGVIAITLALEISDVKANVTAVDISSEALAVARGNAKSLGAVVAFQEGNLLEPLISNGKRVDVVVSNPPYIPEGDREWMKGNVVDHEPALALFAGEDGLDIYRKLVKQLPDVLMSPGIVAFEIGHGQGKSVRKLLLDEFPEAQVDVKLDINGNERIVIAETP